jgi:hypothetical protein
MPRDGALTLSDVLSPTLSIVCAPCNRHGRYSVARLVEEPGDAKLTELLATLTNCPKARPASVNDRCKVEGGPEGWLGTAQPALGRPLKTIVAYQPQPVIIRQRHKSAAP